MFNCLLRLVLVVGFMLLSITIVLGQSIVYVTPQGAGNLSGSSWTNAISGSQLQSRLTTITAGSQVWVAAGLYKPTTGTSQTISFSLHNQVTVYGGFVGNETSLIQRPIINLTTPSSSTLSGDIGTTGLTDDNSFHVVRNESGLDSTAVIDGFVITQGNAIGSSIASGDRYGGGIYNSGVGSGNFCSPAIRNCSFIQNVATAGGAIYNAGRDSGSSNPIIVNCVFIENRAVDGLAGAVYNNGSDKGLSSPRITNCSFNRNVSENSSGGAMVNNGSYSGKSSPTITNCAFSQNTCYFEGGGVYCNGSYGGTSSPVFLNCSFSRNVASQSFGGAVSFFGDGGTSKAPFTNCIVWANSNPRGTTPGINSSNAQPSFTYCNIQSNYGGYEVRPGFGNINSDPFFVDGSTGNLQLQSISPCINSGDPAISTAAGSVDLAGNTRIRNGRIDMGAYEYQGASCTGDLYTIQDGAWDNPAVWSCGQIPTRTDGVSIKHTVTLPGNYIAKIKAVKFESGARLIYLSGSILQLN